MLRIPLLLAFLLLGIPACCFAQTISQTNLPIILITTPTPIEDTQVLASMKIIANASSLNHPGDAATYTGNIGIKLRGSAANPKHSYNVETWTSVFKEETDTSLLGMPSENDWVLLANYTDRSFMRNLIGFYIYEQMGYYAPRMRLVEVILNNDYQGIYLFGEKIKRDVNRLDIAKLKNTDASGLDLTGGYIFKLDASSDDYWTSNYTPPHASGSQSIQFHYEEPQDNEITPVQKVYIRSYTDSFENELNGTDFQDTSLGWRKHGAHKSFEDYLLFNEFMKSKDAYRAATYIYKDKGKKLRVGPPWDLELALYNTTDCHTSEDTGWAYRFGTYCGGENLLPSFWWEKLVTDTTYMHDVKCKYTLYRATVLDTVKLYHFMDSVANLLTAEQATTRNFQKWPIWGVPLVNEPVPLSANYAEEVTKIKSFIKRRLEFLDAKWLSPGCTLGVPHTSLSAAAIRVYPNPAQESMNVAITLQKTTAVKIVVRNMLGQTMWQNDCGNLSAGIHTLPVPSASLVPGVYTLQVTTDHVTTNTFRIIKQ